KLPFRDIKESFGRYPFGPLFSARRRGNDRAAHSTAAMPSHWALYRPIDQRRMKSIMSDLLHHGRNVQAKSKERAKALEDSGTKTLRADSEFTLKTQRLK